MSIEKYIKEQVALHPAMAEQDMVKLCYQAANGGGHILADIKKAKEYFDKEFDSTAAEDIPLYEQISEKLCRVNIAAWKYRGKSGDELFCIFAESAAGCKGDEDKLTQYLCEAEKVVAEGGVGFTLQSWREYVKEYKKLGMPSVHHSPKYRESEKPAYRVARIIAFTKNYD